MILCTSNWEKISSLTIASFHEVVDIQVSYVAGGYNHSEILLVLPSKVKDIHSL